VKDEIVAPEGSTGPQITTGKVWKWMAIDNGVLYALVGSDEYRDKTLRGHKTSAGWPWRPMTQGYDGPNYPWGFGRTLFAMDLATRKVKWLHVEDKPVDGRATCLSDRRICFYSHPNFLAARSADDGSLLWHNDDPKFLDAIGPHDHAQIHLRGYASQPYLFGGRGMLFFAGPQRPRLVAVSAETGKMAWQFADGNMGLVLRDEGLYAMGCTGPSFVFEPTTGKILSNLTRRRGNCTRATGTCDAIFTRGQGNTGTLRLSVPDHVDKRYALMRPGCHGGVIAAGGMFYWGPWMCDCNLTLVGHICLAPAEKLPTNEPPQLETIASEETTLQPVKIRPGDWPTYRADNRRRGASPVTIPEKVRTAWEYRPRLPRDPAAPVTAGGLVFASGSDGVVRALKADDGQCVWRAYTGGPIVFPPAVADGRLLVGSGDGSVYAFEAASGKPLWKYRVGPARRKIDVHGRLTSTWPVGSGVLVHGNTVYAGAGLASFDGTHVCALDTATGKPRWQNDTSGNLGGDGRITGVSVQGHLLLHHNLLFMAGGNVVSPAIYRLKDGKCLNLMPRGWAVRAPRGRELFVVADRVVAFDRLLYGPKDYWANRFFGKHLMQADSDDAVIRTLNNRILKIEPPKDPKDNKLKALWESPLFKEPTALALGENAVVIAGITTEGKPAVTALALDDGRPLWTHPLPSKPSQWSLALDADGHIIIALQDGRYVCLTGE
ncbi:MAG: PQQ-binding-like beta-propeller repeat protein, partial [Pirellulales bacterium]|nr:PQQ-binding-like beta-propeller repeat protein [Pirellulales bacterium]